MDAHSDALDLVIVGAGPSSLGWAIAAQKHGLRYVLLEKGCVVHSIFRFPTKLTLFWTPEPSEIGGGPFVIAADKLKRHELLDYYRRVTEHYRLNPHLYEKVERIAGSKRDFRIQGTQTQYRSRHVAIGKDGTRLCPTQRRGKPLSPGGTSPVWLPPAQKEARSSSRILITTEPKS